MSEIINSVLQARYFTKDEHSWEDVCKRVSNFIGNTDEERERFFNLMVEGKFIPNSPTLFNAGLPKGQLSACFVLPVHDSMASIFGTLGDCAQIFKSGGGCGFSFDELRQKNSPVGESNGVASGAVSFMRVYDAAIESIKAGGRRRGAAMGVLPVNHGDIMDFVKCKTEEGQIKNFNISVMITDDFMEKVKSKRYSDVVTHEILEDGTKRDVTVGEIWQSIVYGAWKNGEPGVVFDGNINKDNKLIKISPIKATNPCGEEPLLPYESCNLGSLNLSAYWKDGKFDDESFEKDIATGVEFLNSVVDKNVFPIKELKAMNDETRKIGLGIMGYHDLLLKMRIPYDSEEALAVLDGIMAKIRRVAERTSHLLAKRDGVFPAWEDSEWTMEVRNGGLLTIAPTGSISLLANCSSGIEPVFNWVYKRRNTVGKEFLMVHPLFDADLRKMVMDDDVLYNEIVNQVYHEGTLQNVDVLPQKVKDLYKCALDITPVWHIRTQATAQKHIDASISKTINLPEHATPADVAEIYTMAYDLGCKGITLYRTNSRKDVVLQNAQQQENGFIEVIVDGEIHVKCPECGGLTKGKGGCNVCEHCGFTKCS